MSRDVSSSLPVLLGWFTHLSEDALTPRLYAWGSDGESKMHVELAPGCAGCQHGSQTDTRLILVLALTRVWWWAVYFTFWPIKERECRSDFRSLGSFHLLTFLGSFAYPRHGLHTHVHVSCNSYRVIPLDILKSPYFYLPLSVTEVK